MTSRPALPPKGIGRKNMGLLVKLRAALRLANLDPDQDIEFDHVPPLAQRPWDEAAQDFDPRENDDRYIVPRQKAQHRKKTAEVDAPAIAKTRRLAKAQSAHADVLERIARNEPKKKPKHAWPKRKMQGRPFGQ